MNGIGEKQSAEVEMITSEGLLIMVEGRPYFVAFADFPFLAALPAKEVFDVVYCGHGHIRWEEADIDLNTEILRNPDAYPVSFQGDVHEAAARLGKVGGAKKTVRKAAASRVNGRKGGRPRKTADSTAVSAIG